MNTSYKVEETPHGVAIYGSLPTDMFSFMAKYYPSKGHDLLDSGIASALGATFVFCSEAKSKTWREEIGRQAVERSRGDRELEWYRGTDTGLSSKTIFYVLSDKYDANAPGIRRDATTPSDPSDFGRCYRLLQFIPEWRSRLGEVAAQFPRWQELIREWDQMEALWLEESPTGRCPKLYIFMTELHAERHEREGDTRLAQKEREHAQYMRDHPEPEPVKKQAKRRRR